MEAPRQGLFSSRYFAAGKSCRSSFGTIEHDVREPIMTPSYIAGRCVMGGSIESRFAHGNTPFLFPSLQNAKSSDPICAGYDFTETGTSGLTLSFAGAELTRPLRGRPQFGKP